MQRALAIVAVVVLILFGGYKIFSGRTHWDDPKSVASKFLVELKRQDAEKAKQYYLPDQADAWAEVTGKKLFQMKSNESNQMKDSIPDDMVFVDAPPAKTVGPVRPGSPPKADANDKRYTVGSVQIGLREIDGKWYVSQSPY